MKEVELEEELAEEDFWPVRVPQRDMVEVEDGDAVGV